MKHRCKYSKEEQEALASAGYGNSQQQTTLAQTTLAHTTLAQTAGSAAATSL